MNWLTSTSSSFRVSNLATGFHRTLPASAGQLSTLVGEALAPLPTNYTANPNFQVVYISDNPEASGFGLDIGRYSTRYMNFRVSSTALTFTAECLEGFSNTFDRFASGDLLGFPTGVERYARVNDADLIGSGTVASFALFVATGPTYNRPTTYLLIFRGKPIGTSLAGQRFALRAGGRVPHLWFEGSTADPLLGHLQEFSTNSLDIDIALSGSTVAWTALSIVGGRDLVWIALD